VDIEIQPSCKIDRKARAYWRDQAVQKTRWKDNSPKDDE